MASEKMVGFRRSLSSEALVRVNCSVAADWMDYLFLGNQSYAVSSATDATHSRRQGLGKDA